MKKFFKNLMPMLLLVAGLGISPNLWAKKVYLVPGVWDQASAVFWVHPYDGGSDVKMTKLSTSAETIYEATVGDSNKKYIITRNKSDSDGPWKDEWARITKEDETTDNCFIITSTDLSTNNYKTANLAQITIYYATSDEQSWKVNVARERNNNKAENWYNFSMTKTDKTYNGETIYTATINTYYGGLAQLEFNYGSTWEPKAFENTWTSTSTFSGKLYDGTNWQTYEYDVTVTPQTCVNGTISPSGAQTFLGSTGKQFTATGSAGYCWASWVPSDGVNATNANPTKVTASQNGNITANFIKRWIFKGSLNVSGDTPGGMPGWDNTEGLTFTNGTATVIYTLEPNKTYKFRIKDNAATSGDGLRGGSSQGAIMSPGESNAWTLNDVQDVLINTVGYGDYTFTITENQERTYPIVYYTAPASHQITMAAKGYTNNAVSTDPSNGGTLTAKTTENETDFDVTTGQYVRDDGSIVFTATHAKGYSFAGFYSDAACTNQITTGVTDNIYTTTITDATSVYAKFTENLTTVVIDWDGDGKVQVKDGSGNWTDATKGTTTVQAGVYTHPSVNAVVTDGSSHYFAKWTWNANADFEAENWDEDHAETKVIGLGAGLQEGQVLTANFLEKDKIYFLDNGDGGSDQGGKWGAVHLYLDAYWDNTNGAGANGKTHIVMSKVAGENDLYWAYIPREDFSKKGWENIAFSKEDMATYQNFDTKDDKITHAVYRSDWNPNVNLYVPKYGWDKHGTYYYNEGYWMKYGGYTSGDEMGYELFFNDPAKNLGKFIATSTNEGRLECRIDRTGELDFCIKTFGGEGYGQESMFTNTNTQQKILHYSSDFKFTVDVDAEGDFTFILKMDNSTEMTLEVIYPVGVGDYRVAWINGDNKRYSDVIKSSDAANVNTLSMYLNPSAGTLSLQKCTSINNGVPVWSEGTVITKTAFDKGQGVYQFDITIANDNGTASNVGLYTGNYYIKTDGVKGGWGNYKENIMRENTSTFSKEDASTYDRYYCQWISNEGKQYNVKCVIANDYCNALSDTLRGDYYTKMSGNEPLLPQAANVRFSYNTYTNTLSRAYISGSYNEDTYLQIHSDDSKLFEYPHVDPYTKITAKKFKDENDWTYVMDVYADGGAQVAVSAKYNNKYQFFVGEGNQENGNVTRSETLLKSGSKQHMRVIYDFKTDRLVSGWMPGGEISSNVVLDADMLLVRQAQGSADQINITINGVEIKEIKTIYAVLQLNRDKMLSNTEGITVSGHVYENGIYWFSLPFDVKVNDIFGVDGYGTKWVLQYYDGDLRSRIGFFAETETFWTELGINDTVKANVGYALCLDPDYFDDADDAIWANNRQSVSFYFPSVDKDLKIVGNGAKTVPVPEHTCSIDRMFADGKKNHMTTDSHWNVIGSPAFQDLTGTESMGIESFYEWQPTDNTYKVAAVKDYILKSTYAYLTQFHGDINWQEASVINPTAAPRYAYADTKNYTVELQFYYGSQWDRTYVALVDNAKADFVLNEDLTKMTNSGQPNIYSYAGAYDVAYNATAFENQTVNLGVIARKNGSYTFAMPKDFSGKAVLVDLESGEATDLNLSNYTIELNKGTYNNRFQLLLEVEAKAPTNMNPTKGEWSVDGKTKKLFINDNIYLINGGRIYNVLGARP